MTRAGLLCLALVATSCANATPFIVTGKSIALLENQFADTGEAMNEGLDTGKISPESYRKWATFGLRFKTLDKIAFGAWETAIELNDRALAGKFGEALALLAAELADFYSQMKAANLLPAGVP